MAHFAKINSDNIVEQVVVINNEELLDENKEEKEQKGIDFLKNLYSSEKNYSWIQTSYNNSFRKNYARIGWIYDTERDAFVQPKPKFESWIFNEETCIWDSPVPLPDDDKIYKWDEEKLNWIEILLEWIFYYTYYV